MTDKPLDDISRGQEHHPYMTTPSARVARGPCSGRAKARIHGFVNIFSGHPKQCGPPRRFAQNWATLFRMVTSSPGLKGGSPM